MSLLGPRHFQQGPRPVGISLGETEVLPALQLNLTVTGAVSSETENSKSSRLGQVFI